MTITATRPAKALRKPDVSRAQPAHPTLQGSTILVADLFCGAGGSSTGALQAVEEMGLHMELVAVNHWNTAIATHQANHPKARHLVEDVSIVDPESVVEEGRLDILMASPECTYYSRARGGKPVHDQGRMNPWAILNWLTRLDVRAVLVENVPEFTKWGPLDEEGHAIKEKSGQYFEAWFNAILSLGYEAQWHMLNAADFGDATTRTRFFLIARKDGVPIEWPEPTHAKRTDTPIPGRRPWRAAREIIDWSDPGLSILDEPRYQRRPLVINTLRRIAKGIERFGGPLAPLYIRLLDIPGYDCPDIAPFFDPEAPIEAFILNRHGENGGYRTHSTNDPAPTTTTRGSGYIVQPKADRFIVANRNGNAPRDIEEPIPPATTSPGGGICLAQAGAKPFMLGQQSGGTPRQTDQPVPTIVASGGKIRLIRPTIILYYGNSTAQDINYPISAITAKGKKHYLLNPTLVEFEDNENGQHPANPRNGIANATLVQANHGNGHQGERGNHRRAFSIEEPIPTVTTRHGLYLANPTLADTDMALPDAYIVPNFGEHNNQEPRTHDLDQPLPAVTSHGAGCLITPQAQQALISHIKQAGIDARRIVIINGQTFILDIRYRMLKNTELARAMGFDQDNMRYEFAGNKTEVTRQIGNAVAVNMAAALVKSILAPQLQEAALQ